MTGTLARMTQYKLEDLLSSASATIGVIIAGTIFLQFLSTKYTELCGRYRELAVEYRGGREDEPRHGPLQSEIRMYRRRLRLMHRASILAAVALMCFLLAIFVGGLSILNLFHQACRIVGTFSLLLGLALMFTAVSLELFETLLSRHELHEEIADLDDHVRDS